MSSLEYAQILADKLIAAGVDATCDPRSATPPCVLFAPPSLAFDLGCGATASWAIFALAPTTGNLDVWACLDGMLDIIRATLPVERADFMAYPLSVENPPHPAYRVTYTEGIDI